MTTAYTNPTIEAEACIICGHIVREDLDDYTLCSHCTGTICYDCTEDGRTHCTEDNYLDRPGADPDDYETITGPPPTYETPSVNNSTPMRTTQPPR